MPSATSSPMEGSRLLLVPGRTMDFVEFLQTRSASDPTRTSQSSVLHDRNGREARNDCALTHSQES